MGLNITIHALKLNKVIDAHDYITDLFKKLSIEITSIQKNQKFDSIFSEAYRNKSRTKIAIAQSGSNFVIIDQRRILTSKNRLSIITADSNINQAFLFSMTNSDVTDSEYYFFIESGKEIREFKNFEGEIDEKGKTLEYENAGKNGFSVLENFAISIDKYDNLEWFLLSIEDHLENKIPDEVLKKRKPNILDQRAGKRIKHEKFGLGKIIEVDFYGVAKIEFQDGIKRMILEYAKLEFLD